MKLTQPLLFVLAWCVATVTVANDAAFASLESMESLTDDSLDAISGQQGIAVSLELRINAKEDGEPVDASECPTVGALSGGSSCRLALNFADRDGIWMVMKNYRGIFKLKNIRLDASTFGGNTAHRAVGSGTYLDTYNPNNKPAIRMTSGNWANATCESSPGSVSCLTYMNQPNYNDLTAALSIERITYEFDSGGTPGYLRDAVTGAASSWRMASGIGLVPDPDNPPDVKLGPYTNTPAGVRLDGRLQIHGFAP